MNNKNLITLSLAFALSAATATAASSNFDAKQANISVPQANSIEREATVYVWPQPHAAHSNYIEKQSRTSDEYWQVVTGAELSKGIQVQTTSDALIRLASYANYKSGAKQVSEGLDPKMLRMSAAGNQLVKAQQIMSQVQMEHAGFTDGSVALKLPKLEQKLTLRTMQNISDEGRYLLHIKEKNSPMVLKLAAKSNVAGLADNSMKLEMSMAEKAILGNEAQVRLLDPKGEEVNVQYKDSQLTFADDLSYFGARQGLYELEVNVSKNIGGKLVKRTVKFPFANTVKTAQLSGKAQQNGDAGFSMPVSVSEPGRYGVTATLQGETADGNLVRLQTISSAAWLDANGELDLPFTLAQFKHYNNLSLVDIKLMDQSRMMVQQVLDSDSSL